MENIKIDSKKHEILIVGCGGIGSFVIKELNRLVLNEQISLDIANITIADFDIVELKNIKYQNFKVEDLGKNKAKVLSDKYFFNSIEEKIKTIEQLNPYDFIICCVDNAEARKLIFEYCFDNDKYFIDMRAEGRAIAIFTKVNQTKKEMMNTLNFDKKESSSCQLGFELENNIIQQGNVIVASIGSQLVLNKLRKEDNKEKYIYYF